MNKFAAIIFVSMLSASAGTSHADAFEIAFNSALDSAFGRQIAKQERREQYYQKLEASVENSSTLVAEKLQAYVDAKRQEFQDMLADISNQIILELAEQGIYPDPVTPDPYDPDPTADHLVYGYDGDGGAASTKEFDRGIIGYYMDVWGERYGSAEEGCNALAAQTRYGYTDVSYTGYGLVVGDYANAPNQTLQPSSLYTLAEEALANERVIGCWSNKYSPSRPHYWKSAGLLTLVIQDADECPLYDYNAPYSQIIPVNDSGLTWHVQFDLDQDGYAETQHAMVDEIDGGVPDVIHAGLGHVTESFTYQDIERILPDEMPWSGQVNLRFFTTELHNVGGVLEETVSNVSVVCVRFGDTSQ